MISAYYSKDCNSRDMFNDLKIAQDPSFETHLNRHNVFFLNIQQFWSETNDILKMKERIQKLLLWDLQQQYPDISYFDKTNLTDSLRDILAQTGEGFIFIIDEWDCLFREVKDDPELWCIYLDFLRNLLKDAKYVDLVYMTGILPVKKYGSQSALNMFDEYSMTDPWELSEFVGFTESEVEALCKKYGRSFDLVRQWYNGYWFPKIGNVYNPKSVVMAMLSGHFNNYWNKTASYETLEIHIEMNFDGLKDSVVKMLGGERARVDIQSFQNDLESFKSKDDVLTLLIHYGYLGYDIETETVFIPNNEISSEYVNAIKGAHWEEIVKMLNSSDQLLQDIWQKDATAVADAIDSAHLENASILKYNDENSLACALSISLYSAKKYYTIIRELPTGKGFADLVFLPRPNHVDKPAMVVELKWDKSADSAIQQIKEKRYIAGFVGAGFKTAPPGQLLLVGINYDKETKKHECVIEAR
ncbi:hypothetical protein AGMMS49938_14070 [Fibrobacterales bacterium]|nr:hypothetical protein AGMMS49938_14070 [Fibrobacterales bacterium]